jgi:hypothetical protein
VVASEPPRERGGRLGARRPICDVALRFLSLVATERSEQYDGWALRWITEIPGATMGRAAEVACSLADAHQEPLALDFIRRSCS